jgi:hypothetical protein
MAQYARKVVKREAIREMRALAASTFGVIASEAKQSSNGAARTGIAWSLRSSQ